MHQTVRVRSPINIALIKYWGKADEKKVLPTTTSLSLTLTDLWTETKISPNERMRFTLNHQPMSTDEIQRLRPVLSHFPNAPFSLETFNNFPTAAGLASSASGVAALTVALDRFFETRFTLDELVHITRLGSGSAVRSLVDGFVLWHQNGHVSSLPNPFPDLRMLIVVVSKEKKAISSREAMKITQKTAPSYTTWLQQSAVDLKDMLAAIQTKDLHSIGRIMERNSEALHAVMEDSQPPIIYQQSTSLAILAFVKALRNTFPFLYTTMDAGPNVKILVNAQDAEAVQHLLEQTFSCSVILSRIGGKADEI
jgi:diphosphomevalonate decarboxylase